MHNQDQKKFPKSNLTVPQAIQCVYNSQSASYSGQLTLNNNSHSHIYYNIVSSFANRLTFLSNYTMELSPQQQVTIKFRINPPNQISKSQQFIGISSSRFPINALCSIQKSIKAKVRLQFNTDIVEDTEIEAFLKDQSLSIYEEARNFLNKQGQYMKASHLFEESFLIYRKNYNALLQMASCCYQMNQFKKSLEYLELFSYFKSDKLNPTFLLLKCKLIKKFLGVGNSSDMIYIEFQKQLQFLLKILMKSEQIQEKDKIEFKEISQQIENDLSRKENARKAENTLQLINQAIEGFDEEESLKQFFQSSSDFQKYLSNILKQEEKDIQETPQWALDPINYEIFVQPMITPSGTSYQREFLTNFFKMHGSKDPYTRTYLNPNSILPNTTLKLLVRNNPNLHKWIRYEHESSKF